jgi:hypothetical protein
MHDMNLRPVKGLVEIIDEVAVSGEEKVNKLEIAKRLEGYHKLDAKAGIGQVAVFETLAELRDEVIKTCSFEIGVEDDGSMKGLGFRRAVEKGDVRLPLNISLPAGTTFKAVSMKLPWLSWTAEYKKMRSLWGFTFTDGVALFHRRRQRREYEDLWEWDKDTDHHSPSDIEPLPRASYVRENGRLFCENPDKLVSAKKVRYRPTREDRHFSGAIMGYYESNEDFISTQEDEDASMLFESYESLISDDMQAIRSGSPIDLSTPLGTPLLAKLKATIDARLGAVVGSELENRRLTPTEIYGLIGRYWDELIFSPWDEKTANEYAILKDLYQRRHDGVNAWSESIKGLFGFKVRTRDHNWIKGYAYCPPEAWSPDASSDIGHATHEGRSGHRYRIGGSVYTSWQYHTMFEGEVISVGRCLFFISKERDQ